MVQLITLTPTCQMIIDMLFYPAIRDCIVCIDLWNRITLTNYLLNKRIKMNCIQTEVAYKQRLCVRLGRARQDIGGKDKIDSCRKKDDDNFNLTATQSQTLYLRIVSKWMLTGMRLNQLRHGGSIKIYLDLVLINYNLHFIWN